MENKKNLITQEKKQEIILNNRKILTISGTNKIISLKKDLIQLDTVFGFLQIFGNNLELIKLDNNSNVAEINGEINSIKFTEETNKSSFIRKIFK